MATFLVIVVIVGVTFYASAAAQGPIESNSLPNLGDSFPGSIFDNFSQLIDGASGNLSQCELQLLTLQQSIAQPKFWALQMLDAWAKLPAGIFQGNTIDLGNYDECHKVDHETGNETVGRIQGRYCQMTIPLNLSSLQARQFPSDNGNNGLTLQLGTCFPATCEASQLNSIFNSSIAGVVTLPKITFTCETPLPGLGAKEVTAIVIFSIVVVLLLFSTMYEVIMLLSSRQPNPNLVMFSIYTNGVKLLRISERPPQNQPKSNQIDCLNGIRVISMVWIVFCHNYMMLFFAPLVNKVAIFDWIKSYHSMLVVGGTVSVDSFFLLSGLLVCWSLLKELDKNRRLNLPVMYLHRYLRLTPALAALMLLSTTLLKYGGSGPMWKNMVVLMEDSCEKYWWSALLYLQNYVNPTEICLGHSWYLSVDMQLFILSPLVIYPLWRWGRKILYVIAVLILLSMGCVIAAFLINNLRLAFVDSGKHPKDKNRQVLVYYPTHIRMGAWLIGVMLGYIMHLTKHRIVRLSKVVCISGWLISLSIMLAILLGDYPLQQPDTYADHPVVVDAIYEATNRIVWAGCLAWIVFACVNGYGGPINTFLSLPIWQPLGKLSYSIYLLHVPIQTMLLGSLRSTGYFSDIVAAHNFWGDFGLTVTISILWCLAFESPMVGLEKLLFGRFLKPKPNTVALVEEQKTEHQQNGSTENIITRDPV
ncbi:nose resistant to fluoxetine protein 6 isoform X1 [Aedes aegypti]|uniref:Nose resistant-to-fluoxetine protein N-terminal domain-containing protein n=1 Tax=Aedes aegypti TaxID=7159 RepID=A0A6I8U0A5_AEDAE|nr:nose resistant to fluoxetine protein 6 isoform X1 [Aedes aegypti]